MVPRTPVDYCLGLSKWSFENFVRCTCRSMGSLHGHQTKFSGHCTSTEYQRKFHTLVYLNQFYIIFLNANIVTCACSGRCLQDLYRLRYDTTAPALLSTLRISSTRTISMIIHLTKLLNAHSKMAWIRV
jgi:hypothetical protein